MVSRRNRSVRLTLLIAASLVAMIAIVSPAEAAKRRVPFGFFGTVASELVGSSDTTLDRQMALMASSGVEIVRVTLPWGAFEPARGVYTWGALDHFVAAAARHRVTVLLNVDSTPLWA